MTLIYQRTAQSGPVTHAFVIGCGRFPNFKSALDMDRGSTVAGARAIVAFLAAHADDLVAPLGSIECLLSDPAVAPGADQLGVALPANDIAHAGPVDAVLKGAVEKAGEEWIDRCQPGDHMLFYMASHGLGDPAAALGLFEDVLSKPTRKWSQSLNVTTLAEGLPTIGAERSWLFLDACQEVVPAFDWPITGVPGLSLIEFSLKDKIKASRRKPLALAAAQLGDRAWAPTDGRAPYFTQALLAGLENLCVEPVSGLGWAVTGEKLWFSLPKVADAAVGWPGLRPEALVTFNEPGVALLKVANPQVAVVLRTDTESHLQQATRLEAVCDDPTLSVVHVPPPSDLAWRFRVPADNSRLYEARLTFPNGNPSYRPESFYAIPPAHTLVLKP